MLISEQSLKIISKAILILIIRTIMSIEYHYFLTYSIIYTSLIQLNLSLIYLIIMDLILAQARPWNRSAIRISISI